MTWWPGRFAGRIRRAILLRVAGGTGAMAAMMALSDWGSLPIEGVPFTTSIVLVTAAPEAAFSQPRNVIGGHLICAICGVAATLLPAGPWQVPAAVGLAMLLMMLTHTLHPPAAINALLPVTLGLGWRFVLIPVAVGAVLLVAYQIAFGLLARRLDTPR